MIPKKKPPPPPPPKKKKKKPPPPPPPNKHVSIEVAGEGVDPPIDSTSAFRGRKRGKGEAGRGNRVRKEKGDPGKQGDDQSNLFSLSQGGGKRGGGGGGGEKDQKNHTSPDPGKGKRSVHFSIEYASSSEKPPPRLEEKRTKAQVKTRSSP